MFPRLCLLLSLSLSVDWFFFSSFGLILSRFDVMYLVLLHWTEWLHTLILTSFLRFVLHHLQRHHESCAQSEINIPAYRQHNIVARWWRLRMSGWMQTLIPPLQEWVHGLYCSVIRIMKIQFAGKWPRWCPRRSVMASVRLGINHHRFLLDL